MKKVLIDTDIGDDIDDALALALAMRSPQVEVTGVTCVYRDTALRARQAKKLLSLCGAEDIPVYAGYGSALVQKNEAENIYCQYTADLDDPMYDYENPQEGVCGESAIDFILESVRRLGDALTLICIGPLTNIARAVRKDPEIMRGARLLMMGGDYRNQYAEWNICCDPEAARIVFESGMDIACVGHDITSRFVLNQQDLDRFFAETDDALQRYLAQIMRLWLDKNRRMPILHDPITVQALITPERFTFEKAAVWVETRGEFTRGMTVRVWGVAAPAKQRVRVACEADTAFGKATFFETVFPAGQEQVLKGAMKVV